MAGVAEDGVASPDRSREAPAGITIGDLFEHPEVLPRLVEWFVSEWEPYYGPRGPGDAEADLTAAASPRRLPIRLVALDREGEPVGTIGLSESSISHPELGPWITGRLTRDDWRRRGLTGVLFAAIEQEAISLGFESIYLASNDRHERAVIEGRGYRRFDSAVSLRGEVEVFVQDLAGGGDETILG